MQIFVSFIVVFLAALSATAEVVEIGDARRDKMAQPFIGTYISHDDVGRERLASIWVDESGIHMWELGGFPVFVWHDFTFAPPYENHSQTEIHYGTGVRRIGGPSKRKKYFSKTDWEFVSANELLFRITETDADGRYMSIEERRFITDGTTLNYLFQRTHYKRRFVFWGEWVPNLSSDILKRSARSLAFTYVKQSPKPLPRDTLEEIRKQRDDRLWAILRANGQNSVVADFAWEDSGTLLEDIKAAAEKARPTKTFSDAEVVTFPGRCEQNLTSESEE